jgi:hypothetical protein
LQLCHELCYGRQMVTRQRRNLQMPRKRMNHFSIFAFVLFVLFAWTIVCAQSPTENQKVVEIQLKEVWALNMPGTRELTDSKHGDTSDYVSEEGPLLNEIRRSLGYLRPEKNEVAGSSFAVLGDGMTAIKEAHAVMVKKKKPRDVFPAGRALSVVFFSHATNRYIHIQSIRRRASSIEIRYHVRPHLTANTSEHFALIPLGELPVGKFTVNMTPLPIENEFREQGFGPVDAKSLSRLVCKPFSFSVVEEADTKVRESK